MIEFRMLGSLSLTGSDGLDVRSVLAQPRRLALLAYLGAETAARSHRRDSLLPLFWPELDQRRGRTALRQALHVLRGALGGDALPSRSGEEVGLDVERVWCDVEAFGQAVAAGRPAEALDLYRGDLLGGFFIPDAPEFEAWLEHRRATLRTAAARSATALADQCETSGDVGGAAVWARRAVQLAPYDEVALRRLLALLDHRGDRAGAEWAYRDFERQLARAFDARPAAETEALIAAVRARHDVPSLCAPDVVRHAPRPPVSAGRRDSPAVGRQREGAELMSAFHSVLAGRSQLVCLAGEPGIGKTTLAEHFLASLAARGEPHRVAHGRCSERLAGTEAYLPLLEALRSLLESGGGGVDDVMRRCAPAWHAQVARAAGRDSHTPIDVRPGSQERLKLEMATLLAALSRDVPLVVLLDDVHWADASTADLLAYLGGHFAEMRALVVVTLRPSELLLGASVFSSVKLELQARGLCRELPLPFLTREHVAQYLAATFPAHEFPATLPELLHAKTEGNPLFVVELARYLSDHGVIAEQRGRWRLTRALPAIEHDLPDSVRSMIGRKLGLLDADTYRILLVASVQGQEFDSAVIARASAADAADVEEQLKRLDDVHDVARAVREERLRDGRLNVRYRFVHVLYQNALYATLTPTRRAELSAAVARAIAELRGDDAAVASELALLYQATPDSERAATYFLRAAEHAMGLCAYRESAALAERGLGALFAVPASRARARRELPLQIALSISLSATKGWASQEARDAYTRASALCEQVGERVQLFAVLAGVWRSELAQANLDAARRLGARLLRLARSLDEPALRVQARLALSYPLNHSGRHVAALEHAEQGLTAYEPRREPLRPLFFAQDPGVECYTQSARALWVLGYADQALRRTRDALALAERLGQPSNLAWAHLAACIMHQLRREAPDTLEHAAMVLRLSAEHGLAQTLAWGKPWHGWALARCGQSREGIAEMCEALDALPALGTEVTRPQSLAVLAESVAAAGDVERALALVADALAMVERTGAGYYEAELLRLSGELMLLQSGEARPAAARFCSAIALARHRRAKSFELRAVMSLCRLPGRQSDRASARRQLARVHGWFTEGFDTPDWREGKALLEALT